MKFEVIWKRKIGKQVLVMPEAEQKKFALLVKDLENKGPIQKEWRNFSDLGKNKYNCHLSFHWVACWYCEKNSIVVEVSYAGSREKAPY
jgi:hypothetical protein